MEGGTSDRAGGSGEVRHGEVWYLIWALKNEEVVARQGQWGRHLAGGTAGAKAERREIAWRVWDLSNKAAAQSGEGRGFLIHKQLGHV